MSKPGEYRTVFRGSAVAAGGRIRRPDIDFLSAAPAVVGVSGGHSESEVRDVRFGEVVQIGSAQSSVRADYRNPADAIKYTFGNYADNHLPTRSVVRTALEGLTVLNADASTRRTLTCKRMLAEMQAEWPGAQGQTSFRAMTASIDDLALDGFGLEVVFRPKVFTDRDTKSKLKQIYESSAAFRSLNGDKFFIPEGEKVARTELPEVGGLTWCTIVESISWTGAPNPNARIVGNKVVYKDFGTVYFGELLISEFSRRLTLARIELGSPWGGCLDLAEIETDGHGYPPY